jgi:hypothetical protein
MCATPSPANLIYTVSYKDILGRFLVAQKESPRMLSTMEWSVAEALLEKTAKTGSSSVLSQHVTKRYPLSFYRLAYSIMYHYFRAYFLLQLARLLLSGAS